MAAREIRITLMVDYTPTGGTPISKVFRSTQAITTNIDGDDWKHYRRPVTTGGAALGNSPNAFFVVFNHDATNFITIKGAQSGAISWQFQCRPGEFACFNIHTESIDYMTVKADTATCDVEVWSFPV